MYQHESGARLELLKEALCEEAEIKTTLAVTGWDCTLEGL